MKVFKDGIYRCYSPALKDFLTKKGITEIEEKMVLWYKEDRIKYMQKHNLFCQPEKVNDLARKCWICEGTEELSKCLEEWTKNRPIK